MLYFHFFSFGFKGWSVTECVSNYDQECEEFYFHFSHLVKLLASHRICVTYFVEAKQLHVHILREKKHNNAITDGGVAPPEILLT